MPKGGGGGEGAGGNESVDHLSLFISSFLFSPLPSPLFRFVSQAYPLQDVSHPSIHYVNGSRFLDALDVSIICTTTTRQRYNLKR